MSHHDFTVERVWCFVPPVDVVGWLVRWEAKKGERTLTVSQIPMLRVEHAQPIKVAFKSPQPMGEVTDLSAFIQCDDGSSYTVRA